MSRKHLEILAGLAAAATLAGGCAYSEDEAARIASAPAMAALAYGPVLRKSPTATRHSIGGKLYYYVLAPCCDQFNPLFDAQGVFVCAPDGGFHGGGDKKCGSLRLNHRSGVDVPNPFYRKE